MELLLASHDKRQGHVETNLKDLHHRFKDQLAYYNKRLKERNERVTEVKSLLKEDVDTKRELNSLRKADQEENYARGMNIHAIYKQKLLEKIVEKRERADKIKEQQMRIAELCRTVRGPPPAITPKVQVSPAKKEGGEQQAAVLSPAPQTHKRGQSMGI